MWKNTVAARHKKLFSIAKKHNKAVMYHCCGNVMPLIDELIEIGVDVLNPLQPLAINTDYKTLKKRFGSKITFHGGIDIQQLLPNGTVQQVKETVEQAKEYLGAEGGYILAPAHHIQADTPIENILAIYGLD
jgi:uroporphyrinogen decarboxylase